MPYFPDNYGRLTYPTATGAQGLYNAQLGAIHAIGAHFTTEEQPAIVTMPTGSGKTAVLMMSPYLLKAARVLVVTPSRLVREQITEDFETLETLKSIGALPADLAAPRIRQLKSRISTPQEWEELRGLDIVVSTPNCASPGHQNIPAPPADLFDLVLIDEAHHSPARTWAALVGAFPSTKKILFTATPFRRDRGEVKGKFIYTYPVARAMSEGIFGKIRYIPVNSASPASSDQAIAEAAEETLRQDRDAGHQHCLMVRTDGLTRADELAKLYEEHTDLRLETVSSRLSNSRVKAILQRLADGEIEGVICVNMMGEGFNFPRLKVAAIHAPHRSLEVTLQFIGRFARTNAAALGEAKFLAVPSEIEIEGQRLFEEGAMWQTLVQDLGHDRIAGELRVRETLAEFPAPEAYDADLSDLSLYSLYPRSHVKMYDCRSAPVDLGAILELDDDVSIAYRSLSSDGSMLVLLLRQEVRPKWSAGDRVMDVEHTLVVAFHDSASQLLFINSSKSAEGLYEWLVASFCPEAFTLSMSEIKRVVRNIRNQRIFNLGMRNTLATNAAESYRIIAGSDTQSAIRASDSRQFRQGHVFLSGESAEGRTTIGYSSGSKVWSAAHPQIPELLDWCRTLGREIRNPAAVVTNSGLDDLPAGEVIDHLPEGVIHGEWPREAFDYEPTVRFRYTGDDGQARAGALADLRLVVDRGASNTDRLALIVEGESLSAGLSFDLEDWFSASSGEDGRVQVTRGSTTTSLVDFLNAFYPTFYTATGGVLYGNEFTRPGGDATPIDPSQLEAWDWTGVAIDQETAATGGSRSIHGEVRSRMAAEGWKVVVYDHGSYEVADFIALRTSGQTTIIRLCHCKGSSEETAGARVDDVYEVAGQAQKSAIWRSLARLEKKVLSRLATAAFVTGTADDLRRLLSEARNTRVQFEIVVIQPGISKSGLSGSQREILGATSDHLVTAGCERLRVIVSA